MNTTVAPSKAFSRSKREYHFSGESVAWQSVAAGWKQLFGSFQQLGVSFEWHDFTTQKELDWAQSFHPGSIEICLNLKGDGHVTCGGERAEYSPLIAGFYSRGTSVIEAIRSPSEQHQFLTIEFSPTFLRRHLGEQEKSLHPLVREVIRSDKAQSGVVQPSRLNSRQQQLISSLCQPPVILAAQSLWYQSKAMELMVEFFFQPEDFFCARQQRVAKDRVEKVVSILSRKLAEPPPLEEIGREVGCSPFYLSRTFSKEMGMTISQYIRQMRMEKAAQLLNTGKHNVTEVALEVGYSSLSHFSTAFHQTYGCCPGLYRIAQNHSRMGAASGS